LRLSRDREGAGLEVFRHICCYGARLHGDEAGSVDRHRNLFDSRPINPDEERVRGERRAMLQQPYVLDQAGRTAVLTAIQRHCAHRGWNLLAAH
ncbi:MAG: hypothetical protein ACRD4I_17450, partial [Candidatus Angelobacter sp.]